MVVEKHVTRQGYWPMEDGSLQRALVEFVESEQLADTHVMTILPRNKATVRVLEFPSHDPAEIVGMVELTADELVPYPADEIVVSSCILKKVSDAQSQVMVAVVHEDVLHEHLQLFQGAGLAPEHIYLSTACMLAALEYPTAHGEGATVYGHSTTDGFELLSLNGGRVDYTRGIVSDGEGGETLSQMVDGVLRGLYRELPQQRSASLYFSSGDQPATAQVNTLQNELSCEVVENTRGLRGIKKGVESLHGIPLFEIGAVLLAQEDSPFQLDVLPQTVKESRARSRSKRVVIQNAAMAGITALLILVAFGQTVYQRHQYHAALESRAEVLRPEAMSVAIKRKHLQRLQDQVARTDTVYEHLGRIVSQAPESGLTLSLFDYTYDGGIILQGRADSTGKFGGLIDSLRTVGKSVYPQLAAAQEVYRTAIQERERDVWEYSISIQFPKDEEVGNE